MDVVKFLRNWVVDIVIMFVFITALQIMLPNNSMKKYIDVIVGFLIIFVIVNPFLKVLSGDIKLEQNYLKRYTDNISQNYFEDEDFSNLHNRQMMELYKQNIGEKIKETIEEEFEYKIEDINLTVVDNTQDSDYGRLIGVSMTINSDKDIEKNSNDSIKISKVKINEKEEEDISRNNFKEDKEIKKIISKNYNVPKENIEVFLNKQMEGD